MRRLTGGCQIACRSRGRRTTRFRAAESLGSATWISRARTSRAVVGLRAGDRVTFERERDAIAALGEGHAADPVVGTLECSVALLDGRFADAERIALEALASLDPASGAWLNATAQLAAAWYWCGRDEELIAGLAAFPDDAAPQKYLLDLVRVSTRARG